MTALSHSRTVRASGWDREAHRSSPIARLARDGRHRPEGIKKSGSMKARPTEPAFSPGATADFHPGKASPMGDIVNQRTMRVEKVIPITISSQLVFPSDRYFCTKTSGLIRGRCSGWRQIKFVQKPSQRQTRRRRESGAAQRVKVAKENSGSAGQNCA